MDNTDYIVTKSQGHGACDLYAYCLSIGKSRNLKSAVLYKNIFACQNQGGDSTISIFYEYCACDGQILYGECCYGSICSSVSDKLCTSPSVSPKSSAPPLLLSKITLLA